MPQQLDLEIVKQAVAGTAAAFRSITEYQPMGGPGDKIFPATYKGGEYAVEERILPGYEQPVPCVLLNSVPSEANHKELALLEAWEEGRIEMPVITVDFSKAGLEKSLRITSLEAPHRIADALLRDSQIDGIRFRDTPMGKQLNNVDLRNATPLFEMCPTSLLLGMWDSTGPKGGLGAKFARALVSEFIGINVIPGVKTSSRIDPAEIRKEAGPLYQAADGGWTLDSGQAIKDKKGNAVKLGTDGSPSEANHGNIPPSISAGGFTIEKAQRTTVLSLPALRRLRFPLSGSAASSQVNRAARTVLTMLGLLAATLTREQGADLRSRCQLHPTKQPIWELLDQPDQEPLQFLLNSNQAIDMYRTAVSEARALGLPWMSDELVLSASPELAALVRESQRLSVSARSDAGED